MKNLTLDTNKLARHLGVFPSEIRGYQVWANCFYVAIASVGYRFVSFKFAKPEVKPQAPSFPEPYRVIRTWDNGYSDYYGVRVISILVQPVDNSQKPSWSTAFKNQGLKRNDIIILEGQTWVKSTKSLAQLVGLVPS